MNKIHLISGPRNISTALMYSFGNRPDMSIVDEPFYAYYLDQHPDIDHPGRAETLESQAIQKETVLSEVINSNYPTPFVFFKNMAHHMDGMDWTFIEDMKNVFLIRNPSQLIASFAEVIPNPTMLDIGLKLEYEILQYLISKEKLPIVIDSNDILANPQEALSLLCSRLDLPFKKEMLQWTAGPRKADGVWAKYWYTNVHQSTGFKIQKTSHKPFPERLTPLLIEANYYYSELRKFNIYKS